MMIARCAGPRRQTIVSINRKQFEDHPDGPMGKAVRYTPRKNKKKVKSIFLPVLPELQAFLKGATPDGLIAVRDARDLLQNICRRKAKKLWKSTGRTWRNW